MKPRRMSSKTMQRRWGWFPWPYGSSACAIRLKQLTRALEAGHYDAAPGSLTQGCELKVEDLSCVMKVVTFDTKHLKLRK